MGGASAADRSNAEYGRGLARAFAGAIIFSFPLMMTMEMWWLGFYLDRLRLLLFLLVTLVLLVPLSRFRGFEMTGSYIEDVTDAVVAFGVGVLASTMMLAVFGIISFGMPLNEVVGKVAVQAIPASFGAILARGQLSAHDEETESSPAEQTYGGQLLLMAAGAVFLTFNVAPTEEMILIAFKMTPLHALALIALSIALLHAFVYAVGFSGQEELPDHMGHATGVISYSVAGYGIAILISLYVLWTFGRTDGASLSQIAMMVAVLGFPASLGAASARLIV